MYLKFKNINFTFIIEIKIATYLTKQFCVIRFKLDAFYLQKCILLQQISALAEQNIYSTSLNNYSIGNICTINRNKMDKFNQQLDLSSSDQLYKPSNLQNNNKGLQASKVLNNNNNKYNKQNYLEERHSELNEELQNQMNFIQNKYQRQLYSQQQQEPIIRSKPNPVVGYEHKNNNSAIQKKRSTSTSISKKNQVQKVLSEQSIKISMKELIKKKMIQKMIRQSQNHARQNLDNQVKSQYSKCSERLNSKHGNRPDNGHGNGKKDQSIYDKEECQFNDQTQNEQKTKQIKKPLIKRKPKKQLSVADIQFLKALFQQKQGTYQGVSLREVANQFQDVSHNTVRRLYTSWKQDPTMRRQIQKMHRPLKMRRSLQGKTRQRIQRLDQNLKQNPFILQKELGRLLNIAQGRQIDDYSFVKRSLVTGGYYRQKVLTVSSNRNDNEHIVKRAQFGINYKKYQQKYSIFHLAHSQYLLFPYMYKETFWTKKDCTSLKNHPYREKTVNFLCIIGDEGHFAYDCKIGHYNQKEFINIMLQLIKSIPKTKNPVLLLVPTDQECQQNLSKKQQVLKLLSQKNGFIFQVLPQDSPQLNPIQCLIRDLKHNMKKMNYETNEQIMQNLQNLSVQIDDKKIKYYYEELDYYINRAILKQTF